MRAEVGTIDDRFTPFIEAPLVRYPDLLAAFASVGLSPTDIKRDELRLDVDGFDSDSATVLVVTIYARNHKGEKYFERGSVLPAGRPPPVDGVAAVHWQ